MLKIFNPTSLYWQDMKITEIEPVVLYDNRCSACSSFARIVDAVSGHRFTMVGHYTRLGEEIRTLIGEDATEMFWVIDSKYAHGGRAGLGALVSLMLRRRSFSRHTPMDDDSCDDGCSGPSAVLYRSCSVLRRSRTLRLDSHGLNT